MKQTGFRFAALAVVGGMLLAGCGTDEAEQPEETPSATTTTASPTAPEVDLEQYSAALVTDTQLMGVPEDPPVEGFVDDPFSMYLTLSDFSPSGTCEELLDELNGYSTPAVAGVAAHFVKDVDAQAEAEANVQTMIFETEDQVEPMAIYRDIPNECGTLSSSEVEGAEAEFTKVPGLDAMYLEISDGDQTESLMMGGSSLNGRYHVYMTAEQVSMEEAQEMLGAQAEKLQQTFQDEVEENNADDETASPTETATGSPAAD